MSDITRLPFYPITLLISRHRKTTDPYLSLSHVPGFQHDGQRWFIPKNEHLLFIPLLRLNTQFHVKIPQHASQNRSHLRVREVLARQ